MNTTATAAEAGLLRSILLDPSDDAVRLVYADWLEDRGQSERVEFIRVQMELAAQGLRARQTGWIAGADVLKYDRLRRRERELLGEVPLPIRCTPLEALWFGILGTQRRSVEVSCTRGFVSRIECTCADFIAHAATIFAAQPVTEVVLTDKRPAYWPHSFASTYGWHQEGEASRIINAPPENVLPRRLWKCLPWQTDFWRKREEAISALSIACVTYGRRLNHLPDLPAS